MIFLLSTFPIGVLTSLQIHENLLRDSVSIIKRCISYKSAIDLCYGLWHVFVIIFLEKESTYQLTRVPTGRMFYFAISYILITNDEGCLRFVFSTLHMFWLWNKKKSLLIFEFYLFKKFFLHLLSSNIFFFFKTFPISLFLCSGEIENSSHSRRFYLREL